MSTHIQLITAEQLLHMPNDSMRRELIAGELKEMSPAGHKHGSLAMRFSVPLGAFVDENNLGEVFAAETGFILARNPDTVRAPDAAFVSQARLAAVGEAAGYFPGPPDLAVEVLSPSDRYSEVESKVESWLDAGCLLVVVIDPRQLTLSIYRPHLDVTVLTSNDTFENQELLPGFKLAVSRIFRESK